MPWTEFRTVQSDAAGRFPYPYSFSDDDSAGVRFLFRAFVPATGGWPFAPATSRPLAGHRLTGAHAHEKAAPGTRGGLGLRVAWRT